MVNLPRGFPISGSNEVSRLDDALLTYKHKFMCLVCLSTSIPLDEVMTGRTQGKKNQQPGCLATLESLQNLKCEPPLKTHPVQNPQFDELLYPWKIDCLYFFSHCLPKNFAALRNSVQIRWHSNFNEFEPSFGARWKIYFLKEKSH